MNVIKKYTYGINAFVSRIEAQLERGNYAVAVFMSSCSTSTLGSYRCLGTVSIGTPQGGMASPLDLNMVADGLLSLLNGGRCYAQAYVDNFAVVTGNSDLALQSTSCSAY